MRKRLKKKERKKKKTTILWKGSLAICLCQLYSYLLLL